MSLRFEFLFVPSYRLAALPFFVMPATSGVVVSCEMLTVRFGPWKVRTALSNVASAQMVGPFGFLKSAGPARLSFADRGLSFATNPDRGVCIRFGNPVAGIEPTGIVRHPGLTVTVADPEGLCTALQRPA